MSKILIEGNKVIIEGHAHDLETCNTLTNLCDELSTSDKFRTVKYESGYGEFESVSENEEKKFVADTIISIYTNDGKDLLAKSNESSYSIDGLLYVNESSVKYDGNISTIYNYNGSKLFAGLATSANAIVPKYKPGDTIRPTSNTTLYIVENIIIPEHHSSLTELFTNIATVIREKTGDTELIIADDFPDVIRERLQVAPLMPKASLTPKSGVTYTDGLPSDWNIMKEIAKAISEASGSINANTTGSVYVSKGNTWAYKITPGDTISVTSASGTHTYAVMGFNNFALTNQANYGGTHSVAGLTFGSVDCVGKYKMNSSNTNYGGWGDCLMRTSTMPTLQSGMPDTLALVKVPYVDYDNQNVVLYSDDHLFLPAEKEVCGTRSQSPTAEANALTQFAYYKNGGSKIKSLSGSAVYWWLRSAYYDAGSDFCIMDPWSGTGSTAPSLAFGAAPCFCV